MSPLVLTIYNLKFDCIAFGMFILALLFSCQVYYKNVQFFSG